MKKCTKCLKEFPATSKYFYRHVRMRDGFQTFCKSCSNEYKNRKSRKEKEIVRGSIPKLRNGQWVVIKSEDRTSVGRIVGKYNHHILVDNGRYKESYAFADMYSGKILVK